MADVSLGGRAQVELASGRGRFRRTAGLECVALVVVLMVSAAVATAARAGTLSLDNEDPTVQADAVATYESLYGVSAQTATQRLQIQDAAEPELDSATAALGGAYAGSWFDPNDQGRLEFGVVGLSAPVAATDVTSASAPVETLAEMSAAASTLSQTGVDSYSDFVPATYSLATLQSIQSQVNQVLAGVFLPDTYDSYISFQHDAVVVRYPSGAGSTEVNELTAVEPADSVVLSPTDPSMLGLVNDACAYPGVDGFVARSLFCDSPLRGADSIGHLVGSKLGECTAGFVVYSDELSSSMHSTPTPYLLTAGHCLASAGTEWATATSNGKLVGIGAPYYDVFGSGGDYGLIKISNPSYWKAVAPASYVWVGPTPSGATTSNPEYSITTDMETAPGQIVCLSSGVPIPPYNDHTSCGAVDSGYHSDGVTNGLFEANYCDAPGSSGGPIYKNHFRARDERRPLGG